MREIGNLLESESTAAAFYRMRRTKDAIEGLGIERYYATTTEYALELKQLGFHGGNGLEAFLEERRVKPAHINRHGLPEYLTYHVNELLRIKGFDDPAGSPGAFTLFASALL